jgi:hypothetical protein
LKNLGALFEYAKKAKILKSLSYILDTMIWSKNHLTLLSLKRVLGAGVCVRNNELLGQVVPVQGLAI